eukprot:TRINITY_DN4947_c0_g1_i2.p1 TRINITY_DN4947_c0_g1~~TRINITY_DN4947_c0_g1_i2.p1  ORF type:complete len:448 (-),score=89.19 TRINITY_DN4947_c0_g1_i2:95-1438(-)
MNYNKFYIVQALESTKVGAIQRQYWCFCRWGRVGEVGQHKLRSFSSRSMATAEFKEVIKDKTKAIWGTEASFIPHPSGYNVVKRDYEDPPPAMPVTKLKENSHSTLDPRVRDLIRMIFDTKMMEKSLVELNIDVSHMPLNSWTDDQIMQGYNLLKQLEEVMNANKSSTVIDLTAKFYANIRHNFGRKVPHSINNPEAIKLKEVLLSSMRHIRVAFSLMGDGGEEPDTDDVYKSIHCKIEPVELYSDDYAMIHRYLINTYDSTHNMPTIKNIFYINREEEAARYDESGAPLGDFTPVGKRKLLWHGARLVDIPALLAQGLQVPPPEAPRCGYRFGKGIYFSDMSSWSAMYCRSSASPDCCLLLADVALGQSAQLERDTYMEQPQPGTDSTWALGTIEPNPNDKTFQGAYLIPWGSPRKSGRSGVSCIENQYIVYQPSQVMLRYLVHFN